jgi:hypothetical protein
MGFIRGVFTGVAVAVGAAAWYMSRAGTKFRDRWRVDRRLGELGDEIELRTRDVRAKAGAQMAEVRTMADAQMADVRDRASAQMSDVRGRVMGADDGMTATLDEAQAAAAEEAAEIAADVEAKAGKMKKAAKSAEADAESDAGS